MRDVLVSKRFFIVLAGALLILVAGGRDFANAQSCEGLFKSGGRSAAGFTVETNAANFVSNLTRLISKSTPAEIEVHRDKVFKKFLEQHPPDDLAKWVIIETIPRVYEIEIMSASPDFQGATLSSLNLVRSRAGEIHRDRLAQTRREKENEWNPLYSGEPGSDSSTQNMILGLATYARLFDPEGLKTKYLTAAYLQAQSRYSPDVGVFEYGGERVSIIAAEKIKQKYGLDEENTATESIADEFRATLKSFEKEGVRLPDYSLQGELRSQFAQLMLFYKKSADDILALRAEAKTAVEAAALKNKSKLNDELYLGIVSVHLETGITIRNLVSSLASLEKPFYDLEFSQNEKIWILRMAYAKRISVDEASYAVWAIRSTEPDHRPMRVQGTLVASPPGQVDQMMLALLAYSHLTPAQIVAWAEALTLESVVKTPDALVNGRVVSLLGRSLLQASNYAPQMKLTVAHVMSGPFVRE